MNEPIIPGYWILVVPLVLVLAAASDLGCRASSSSSTEVASPQSIQDASRADQEAIVDASSTTDLEESAEASEVEDAPAWTKRLVLKHASHVVEDAPTVVVHAPPRYDPTPPLQLVVFFHGWSGCAAVLEATGLMSCRPEDGESKSLQGWGLGERHDAGGTNTILVVPQLAFNTRDGSPGRFSEKGFFREFLVELLTEGLAAKLGGPRAVDDVNHITLVAHSAGFKTTLAVMQQGGVDELVEEVVLFDALYAAPAVFAEWASKSPQGRRRRVVSLYTAKGRTYQLSQMLARYAREQLGEDEVASDPTDPLVESIRNHRVVVARSPVGHGSVPARHLAEVLQAFELRRRVE